MDELTRIKYRKMVSFKLHTWKTLYILGGEANDGEMVNSIEKLTKIDSHSDLSNFIQWLLIQLD